jgi:hypothetical protein
VLELAFVAAVQKAYQVRYAEPLATVAVSSVEPGSTGRVVRSNPSRAWWSRASSISIPARADETSGK